MQKREHSLIVNFERKYLSEIKSKAVAFCAFSDTKIKEVYECAFRSNTWKIQASYLTFMHLQNGKSFQVYE